MALNASCATSSTRDGAAINVSCADWICRRPFACGWTPPGVAAGEFSTGAGMLGTDLAEPLADEPEELEEPVPEELLGLLGVAVPVCGAAARVCNPAVVPGPEPVCES